MTKVVDFWVETLIPSIVLAFIMTGVGFLAGWDIASGRVEVKQCEILGGVWHEGECRELSGQIGRISE
jgi:uncharacterized protein YbbC (DUF1343 family)